MSWKLLRTPFNAIDVRIDNQLAGEWGSYYLSDLLWPRAMLLVGVHRWHEMIFLFETKPNILETDPGPLDAKAP